MDKEMVKEELFKHNGFKLISLDLRGNKLMGKSNIFYDFLDKEDKQDKIYSTIIIGVNGTGKSNLFRIIIELFKELHDLSQKRDRSYAVDGRYKLKYSLNGDIYDYGNLHESDELGEIQHLTNKNPLYLLKNGDKMDFTDAQFPISIVANSIMLTDKYPFFRKVENSKGEKEEAFPQYKYLGLRNIPQSASTRAFIRKTVEFMVQQINSEAFREGLIKATDFLGLARSIDIIYYTLNTPKFFNSKLNPSVLESYFEAIKTKYPNPEDEPPFKLSHYKKIEDDKELIARICEFVKTLISQKRLLHIERSSTKMISYDILNDDSYQLLKGDFEILEHLRQLGMVSAPEIQLKRGSDYSLEESSSGEYHFFSSMVGLMATIKPHSLIIIDEPEVSLHPNWQMKYLAFTRELFANKEYATCHLLIATHSHFLISDLKRDNSKIIGLKRDLKNIEIVDLPKNANTFGWSAEQILLEVFKVPTTRNYFIADKVGEILEMVSKAERDVPGIKLKVQELIESNIIDLSPEDPLKPVIDKLVEKYA